MTDSAAPPSPTPVPGWYPDPNGRALHRYWDGEAWTAHTAPTVPPPGADFPVPPAAPTPDHGPSTSMHWLLPVGRSWQSLLAGYMGIGGLVFAIAGYVGVLYGLATIGMGVWALIVARSGGHGSGRAVFGIIAGALTVVAGFATVSWWA